MGTVRTTTTLAIGILVVVLTGCTPTAAPSAESTPSASAASASDSEAAGPASPAVATPHPCDSAKPAYPVSDPADPEQLGGMTLAVPFDQGVFTTASGEATLNADGVPVAYHVASGDVFSTVAARFCLSEDWLLLVNHVRRDNDGLYAGDTLNLDPHTIFSVGDQNGVITDHAFPDGYKLPPQR